MRIFLIGYSYSGKSTLGRQLAAAMDYAFFDTDKAIEQKYHTTIPLLFSHYGEKTFRSLERQMLFSTASLTDTVIATGGGTPCNDENIAFILSHGTAVHLRMSPDDIMRRAALSRKQRPMLAGLDDDQRRAFVTSQLQSRMAFYSQAHIELHAISATAESIAAAITAFTASAGTTASADTTDNTGTSVITGNTGTLDNTGALGNAGDVGNTSVTDTTGNTENTE